MKARNLFLLVASYAFYAQFPWTYLLSLAFVTLVNYGAVSLLERRKRKWVLAMGIVVTLLPLFGYKYLHFLLAEVCQLPHTEWCHWLLPVGVSFFSFQALTYTIDYYRGKITQRESLMDYALFVSFFPTLLSGPVERARNLLPQISTRRSIAAGEVMSGITLFVWGVFKKAVVADRLAQYVDWVYGTADYRNGTTLAVAAILYSIQIYCDFSGYSDMAIGVARTMGFRVMKNFRFPYFAHTLKEFWHRWHISLTGWFTEYVYFPLGGSRVKSYVRWVFNISMVFLLSGLWHGAAWNFVLWGALHALFYLMEHLCGLQKPEMDKKWRFPRMVVLFLLVSFAWMFFRIDDMDQVWMMLSKIATDPFGRLALGASAFSTVTGFMLLFVMLGAEWLLYAKNVDLDDTQRAFSGRNLSLLVAVLMMIALFSVSSDSFVYFQF